MWKDEAEKINEIFQKHGLPTIPTGTKNWQSLMLQNIEELSKLIEVENGN
jgi:hypothetical protein